MLGAGKCLLLSYYGKLVLVTLNAYIFGPIATGLRQPVQNAMAGGSRFLASHRPGQFSTFNYYRHGIIYRKCEETANSAVRCCIPALHTD